MRHLYALVFLLFTGLASAQTFTSVTDGDWDDPNTWDLASGYPEAGDIVIISDGDIVDNNGTQAAASITINGTGRLNFNTSGTVTVSGDVTMEGSSRLAGSGSTRILNITGDLNLNGSTNQIAGITFSISGTTNISDGTQLRITSNVGSKTTNDLVINGSGNIRFGAQETLTISNNLTLNGTSRIFGSTTATLNTVDATINGSGVSFERVTFSSSGTTTVADGGQLTFANTLGGKTFEDLTINGTGSINFTSAETVTVNGTFSMNGTSSVDGSSTGRIIAEDLVINGSDVDLGRISLDVNSQTTISDGALLTFSYATFGAINLTDITLNGTSSLGGGAAKGELDAATLNFAGTSHTIGETDIVVSGTTTIGSTLTFSSSSGSFSTGGLILNADFTLPFEISVDGELDLSGGTSDLTMADHDLSMEENGSVKGGGPGGYIKQTGNGRFKKKYPTTGFSDPITIPFGDDDDYAPMTFTLKEGSSVSSGAMIRFRYVEASGHPNRNDSNTGDLGDDLGVASTDYVNDYWEFTTSNISDINFDATCDFSTNGKSGPNAATSMFPVIYRRATPPGGSETYDWHVTGYNNNFGTGSVSLSGLITFNNIRNIQNVISDWVLYAMDNLSPGTERLPITLISFEAEQFQNHVELEWATADEVNNDFFTIERSRNGLDFQPILTVSGAGNSEIKLEYQAIDPAPFAGRNYYRLKQTDFNGEFEYSEVLGVNFVPIEISMESIQAYPNPSKRGEPLMLSGIEYLDKDSTSFRLIDNSGQLIKSGSISDLISGKLTLSSAGLYLLLVKNPEGQKVLKILVD